MRLACCVRCFTLSFCSHKTPWTWEKTNYSFTHRCPCAFSSFRRRLGYVTCVPQGWLWHESCRSRGPFGGPWLWRWTGWPALFGSMSPGAGNLKTCSTKPICPLDIAVTLSPKARPDMSTKSILRWLTRKQTDSLMLIKWSVQVHARTYRGCAWPPFPWCVVMSVNGGLEFEMCGCLPCAEKLQAKQAHLVWKTEGKKGSSKLLISDRQSSLSCDSIVVEWSPGVCEFSLWQVSRWGWRWAGKKRLPDEDGSEKNGRRSVSGGSTFLKVAGFAPPPLASFSVSCRGFASTPHLSISERKFVFVKRLLL